MSKSYGNDISLNDSPNDMYGKTLSIPDEQIEKWFVLATDANGAVIRSIRKKLNDPNVNPMSVKKQLAKTLVELYYNKEKADGAEKNFQNVIIEKEYSQRYTNLSIETGRLNCECDFFFRNVKK